jgi:hypothetical protein
MTLSKAKGKSKDLLYCTLATKLWVPHPFAYFAKGGRAQPHPDLHFLANYAALRTTPSGSSMNFLATPESNFL